MEIKETSKPRRYTLRKLAVCTLILMLVIPGTRMLLTSQLRNEFTFMDKQSNLSSLHRAAIEHPGDLKMQLADATTVPEIKGEWHSVSVRKQLQSQESRFPAQPALYAGILRYMTMGEVGMTRDEEYLLTDKPAPTHTPQVNLTPGYEKNSPDQLAIFDAEAAKGESLDPENAYFPLMRAAGLFAGHHDDEALAEIHRAAQKQNYEDYTREEMIGHWNLSEAAYGEQPAVQRLTQAASTLFPHLSRMRGAARIATYKAVELELAGDSEKGFMIRKDIMRIGSLMREKSRCVIGGRVGMAITGVAASRPGGAPYGPNPFNNDEEFRQQRQTQFIGYLQKIGHIEEAQWLRWELKLCSETNEIVTQAMPRSLFKEIGGSTNNYYLPVRIAANQIPLGNILVLLAFGGAAAIMCRMREKKINSTWRSLFGIMVVGMVAIWQMRVMDGVLAPWMELMKDLGVKELPAYLDGNRWFVASSFIVPGILFVLFSEIAIFSRVPILVALGRGFRGLAIPAICALVLLYGVSLGVSAGSESRLNTSLNQTIQHDGKYLASLVGKTWPGSRE